MNSSGTIADISSVELQGKIVAGIWGCDKGMIDEDIIGSNSANILASSRYSS